jgi:hypothetical protein
MERQDLGNNVLGRVSLTVACDNDTLVSSAVQDIKSLIVNTCVVCTLA